MKPSAPPSEDAVLALRDHGGRTPVFTLKSTATWARVVSQHDADTLTAVFSVFGTYYKFPIRLFGIDACEMTARNSSNKALALRARDRLFQLVTGRRPSPGWKKQDFEAYFEERVCVVWLECCDFDKYGRLLAHVYPAENCERSFSDVLVDEKLAYAYQGGAKLLEEEQRRVLSPPSVEERSPLTHGSVHIEPVRIGRSDTLFGEGADIAAALACFLSSTRWSSVEAALLRRTLETYASVARCRVHDAIRRKYLYRKALVYRGQFQRCGL